MPIYYRPKEEFEIISKEQIEQYLNLSYDEEFKVLLALVWLTGARISEVIELKPSNFMVSETEVLVSIKAKKHGKVGYRLFDLEKTPFLKDLVLPYVFSFPKESRMFFRSKRRYEQLLKELNESIHGNNFKNYITFHQLRHSRTTYLARILKAFPEELKAWFGHRSNAFEEYYQPRRVERFKDKIM